MAIGTVRCPRSVHVVRAGKSRSSRQPCARDRSPADVRGESPLEYVLGVRGPFPKDLVGRGDAGLGRRNLRNLARPPEDSPKGLRNSAPNISWMRA